MRLETQTHAQNTHGPGSPRLEATVQFGSLGPGSPVPGSTEYSVPWVTVTNKSLTYS